MNENKITKGFLCLGTQFLEHVSTVGWRSR